MASVTGYTAARMQEIEDSAIVGGAVVGDDLILTRYDTTTINAGNVRGPIGPTGVMPSVAMARAVFGFEVFQTIANVTTTTVLWPNDSIGEDPLGFHSTSTNTGRMTVPSGYAGVYLVSYVLNCGFGASNIAQAWIQKNATSNRYGHTTGKHDSSNGLHLTGSSIIPLSVGDYVQIITRQNSGGDIYVGDSYSEFCLARIGPL